MEVPYPASTERAPTAKVLHKAPSLASLTCRGMEYELGWVGG